MMLISIFFLQLIDKIYITKSYKLTLPIFTTSLIQLHIELGFLKLPKDCLHSGVFFSIIH